MKKIDLATWFIGGVAVLLGIIFMAMSMVMYNSDPDSDLSQDDNTTVTRTAEINDDSVDSPNSTPPPPPVTVTSTSPQRSPSTSAVSNEQAFDLKAPLSPELSDGGLLPGTEILILRERVGDRFTVESCTVAFSLPMDNGSYVAVTAGHCGSVGQEVYSEPVDEYFDSATRLGTVSHVSVPGGESDSGDWAVISLNMNALHPATDAQVPLRIDMSYRQDGQWLCKNGSTTGYACGEKTMSDATVNLGGFGNSGFADGVEEVVGIMDQVKLCSLPGDSGSPVYDNQGIVGVLSSSSATEIEVSQGFCNEGRMSYYSPVSQVIREIMIQVPGVSIPVKPNN